MPIGIYVSLITLNVNELNTPTERYRLTEWIQKQEPYICGIHIRPRPLKTQRHIQTESKRMEKDSLCNGKPKESWSGNPISDKID